MRVTSCGVLVRDAAGLILLGQATGAARWDIPKGVAEPNEAFEAAALRELREETGLQAVGAELRPLGTHRYLPAKDLVLFGWQAGDIDVSGLRCTSLFRARDGRMLPEFARFALLTWDEALGRVGKNMRRVLEAIGSSTGDRPPP